MKKKFTRNVLALSLVLVMTLAFAPLTASAVAPGVRQEDAVELEVGQTGTFQGLSGIVDDWDAHFWFKFQLSAANKVVITLNVPAAPIDHTNDAYVFVTASDIANEMNRYVDGVGGVDGLTLEQSFEAGNLGEEGQVISRTGTYYLGEGLYYICISCDLDEGITATVKIDSIEPISNTGGLTMETARTVDPAREVIKQTRFDEEEVEGRYYYKFTLIEDDEVSIQKSVKLVPSVDDRQNFVSSLFLSGPDTDMLGTVDGEDDVSPLDIAEKDDVLTKTITYSLPAGTYYVYLNNYLSSPGTECTLSFTMKGGASTPIPFTDIPTSAWYYNDVKTAWELGLINGKSATTFAPDDNLAYNEAVKLAACMHQLYTTGSVTLTNGGLNWYDSYVDYAKDNGIISKDYDWNVPATRAGYLEIFANAMPAEELAAINTITDGAILDVPMTHPQAEEIYMLYRAGIVQGVDAAHNCDPGSNIKRSEVSAVLTRMMDSTTRIPFSM